MIIISDESDAMTLRNKIKSSTLLRFLLPVMIMITIGSL